MRYAVYLTSNYSAGSNYGPDDDYFCVLDSIDDVVNQVHEFRTWELEEDSRSPSDFDELTDIHKGALLLGDPVTLKSCLSAICIRPIVEKNDV